jgi:hypothetical protein
MNNVLPAEKWLQYLKSSGKRVYILGAGSVAVVMKTALDDYGIDFLFADNNPDKVGGSLESVPIVSVAEMAADKNKVILFGVVREKPRTEMMNQLLGLGVRADEIAEYDLSFLNDSRPDFVVKNFCRYENILNKLTDDLSKRIYTTTLQKKFLRFDCAEMREIISDEDETFFDESIYYTLMKMRHMSTAARLTEKPPNSLFYGLTANSTEFTALSLNRTITESLRGTRNSVRLRLSEKWSL